LAARRELALLLTGQLSGEFFMSLFAAVRKSFSSFRPFAVLLAAQFFSVATLQAQPQPDKNAPAFDCQKASGEIEALICQDAELATLDRDMAGIFKRAEAKNSGDELKTLKAMQRGWIKGRNDCWKAQDKRQCVIASYNLRMVELQIQNGLVIVPTAVGYVCNNDNSKPFFATFYNELKPPAAVITYGDDQTIALAAPAASGSKYSAEGISFWEHHGEATVEWYGTQLTCIPRK
jgi:uncharacterized protein